MKEHVRETRQCQIPHPKICLIEIIRVMEVDNPSLPHTAAQFW